MKLLQPNIECNDIHDTIKPKSHSLYEQLISSYLANVPSVCFLLGSFPQSISDIVYLSLGFPDAKVYLTTV